MSNKNKTYAYVGAFRFPDKDAAAKRVLGIGKIISKIGHKVIFLGGESGDGEEKIFEGFSYYSQNELDVQQNSVFGKISKFINSGKNTLEWLIKNNKKVDSVIVYNSSNLFLLKIKKFCLKYKKELIVDCTEWYDSKHLPGGKFGLVAIDNFIKMNYGYKHQVDKMIVISSYLQNYYSPYLSTCKIPPLNSYPDFHFEDVVNNKLKIIYAGSPGQKDDLITVIKALDTELLSSKLEFLVIGIDKTQINYPKIPTNINFMGRITHEEVLKNYLDADFSVIIRPNMRYANAGFSTKFVESNYFGVPVITTNTSDLGKYINNSENGFIIDSNDNIELELRNVFFKIVGLDTKSIIEIKKKSKMLSNSFNLKNYINELEEFLEK